MTSPQNIGLKTSLCIGAGLGALVCIVPILCSAQMNAPLTGHMDTPAPQKYLPPVTSAYVQPASRSDMAEEPEPVMQPIPMATPTYQGQVAAKTSPAPAQGVSVVTLTTPISRRPIPRKVPDRVGAETRAVMAAQADGRAAGPELPILGPVASANWRRYLESFSHPIPEAFSAKVGSGGSGGSGGN